MNKLISQEAEQRVNQQNLMEREAKDAIEDKNSNFVQVQKKAMRDLRRLVTESPRAASLLLLLAEKMNRQNAVMISYRAMGEITGLSRVTLSNAISTLEREKWLQIVKIGTANAYLINSRAFWQSGYRAKVASFSAQIIATESEQPQGFIEQWEGVEMRQLPIIEQGERAIVADDELPPPDQQEMDLN